MINKKILILFFCFLALEFVFIPFVHAEELDNSIPWQEFKKIYGDDWKVRWNEKTGTPHRVFGNRKAVSEKDGILKRERGESPLSETDFEGIARAFIDQNKGLFRIDNSDLHLQRSKKHGGIFYVTFRQFFKDIPVYNSRVDFQFDENGNLLLFGADVHPDVNISTLQKISEGDAIQIVKDDINFNPEEDKISKLELLIYPEEVKEGFEYYLVWRLEVYVKKPLGNWIYFIDAENGEIKVKYNDIKNNIEGKITGHMLPRSFIDTPQEVPFPYESVFANSYKGVSDNNGNYSISTDVGSYSLTSRIEGKYLKVTKESGGDAYFSTSVNDGESKNIIWDTNLTSGKYDEMNVYYHSMKMHDYIKSIDPDFTGVDYCMPAVVGITDKDSINSAYYDWYGINFGAGDGVKYRSAALSSDVIYHEYSHGINHNLYKQEGYFLPYIDGTESGAMEEGFASYWACSLIGDSKFGIGFYPGGFFWEVDNNLIYPYDLKDEVHDDGWIIAGAMWRLRKVLGQAAADRLFHFARYGLPTTFEDFFLEVLIKDDNNNNLKDGTPNSLQIYSAFGNHGISGLQIKAVSIDDRDGGNDNGKMNPGERINLIITLENKMFENAEDVAAVLSTEDIFADIISGQANFGSINEETEKAGSFTILLNNSTPADYLLSFNLKISNKKGYTFDLPFSINVFNMVEKKWKIENITSVNNLSDYASSRALERDKDGNLHLVYGYNSLYYAFYNGDKWAIYLLDNTSLYPYNYSLALANNVPNLVFNYTDSNGNYLKYAKLTNGQWETEIIYSTSYLSYSYPSLIFDANNYPYISYSFDSSINYTYRDGANWKTEIVDTVHCGSHNSIGIGKNSLIQVSYYDFYCGELRYAKREGSKWEAWFLDAMVDAGEYTCLRIGTDGWPHICYYDKDKGNLKYIYWDGYWWEAEIVDMDGDVGLYPSIAMDLKNRPHIAYYDKTNGALKYAYYNGSFWEIETLDDSGDAGYYPSLVVDDNGLPHAVYYTKSSDGNMYLKFASSSFMTSPLYLRPSNNSVTDVNVTFKWMVDYINEGDVLTYDIYLDTVGANTKIAEGISAASYTVDNLEYGKVYYWRIIYRNKYGFEMKGPIFKFKTPMAGDIDKNGIVDGNDLVSFASSFGSTKDFKLYETISDIDRNGRIDGADLMFLGMNFGKSY